MVERTPNLLDLDSSFSTERSPSRSVWLRLASPYYGNPPDFWYLLSFVIGGLFGLLRKTWDRRQPSFTDRECRFDWREALSSQLEPDPKTRDLSRAEVYRIIKKGLSLLEERPDVVSVFSTENAEKARGRCWVDSARLFVGRLYHGTYVHFTGHSLRRSTVCESMPARRKKPFTADVERFLRRHERRTANIGICHVQGFKEIRYEGSALPSLG